MILVTGGTGLVGAHLLYKLTQDGKRIRAIHRASSDLENVKKIFSYYSEDPLKYFKLIDWVVADITDVPSLEAAFNNITLVYHCAAFISFDDSQYKLHRKINIEGTANVVNLCIANKVKKLCYTSSVAAIGKTEDGSLINEETSWNPEAKNNMYGITKYGAEMEVWRASQENVEVVIINPGVILGPGYWHTGSGQLIKLVAKGMKFYTKGSVSFVDVRDVVNILIRLSSEGFYNERYIVVSENRTYNTFFNSMAKSVAVAPPKYEAKPWVLQLFWRLDWVAHNVFGKKRSFFKANATTAVQHLNYDHAKIVESLDYKFIPLDQTISFVGNKFNEEY